MLILSLCILWNGIVHDSSSRISRLLKRAIPHVLAKHKSILELEPRPLSKVFLGIVSDNIAWIRPISLQFPVCNSVESVKEKSGSVLKSPRIYQGASPKCIHFSENFSQKRFIGMKLVDVTHGSRKAVDHRNVNWLKPAARRNHKK